MIRKGLFLAALAAGAMMGAGPAQASIRLAATSGIINQLHNNSSLKSNNMAFTICQNGSCQTLFTGVAGVRALNNDLSALNDWAGTSSYAGTGGFFDNYRFTFSGAGSYFGNNAPAPSAEPTASLFLAAPPIPEPATWAMMILGFGLVGIAMRRRRTSLSFG